MASMIPYDRYARGLRTWPFDAIDNFFDAPLASLATDAGFKMNVEDAGEKYVVTAELPGVTRDQIDVELNEGELRVERHAWRLPEGRRHRRPVRQARGRHPDRQRPQAGREGQRHQDLHRLA